MNLCRINSKFSIVNDISLGPFICNSLKSLKLYNLNFKLINAWSLNNKETLLIDYLHEFKDHILCFTETYLSSKIPLKNNSLLVGDTNFHLYRADRKNSVKKKGGGVCVFIPKHYPFTVLYSPPVKGVEYLAVDIYFGSFSFTLIVVYLPPNSPYETVRNLCETLLLFLSDFNKHFLIVGDFNLPSIDWQNLTGKTDQAKLFLDFLTSTNLTNCVLSPTRISNILDLVISNFPNKIFNVFTEPPFGTADHNIVNFSFLCDESLPPLPSLSFKNFKNADFLSMSCFFQNHNWTFLTESDNFDIDLAYDEFVKVVSAAINLFVDTVTPSLTEKLPTKVKDMIKYRDSLPRSKENFKKISLISKKILALSKKAKNQREAKILKKNGIKGIFTHLGKYLKNDTSVPALKTDSATLFSEKDKANALAQSFATNFHSEKSYGEKITFSNQENILPFFTKELVVEHLKQLKPKCNTSPDCIPYIILKKCAHSLAHPIAKILNLSFMQGKVPKLWKLAHIVPVFKKGDKHFPCNYRPISLNCSLSAIPQKIIVKNLTDFLEKHEVIPHEQHGFRKFKNVTTNLLETFDFITEKADKNIPCDIIYFDVKKAFDRLNHALLFAKLKKWNFPNSVIAWIQAFLSDRKFRVKVGNCLSEFFEANSGVPQGSKIGPLLFLFFISDLISCCDTPGVLAKLFADDLKAISDLLVHNNSPLHKFLQKLENYIKENGLEIATNKCNVLHCLPKKNPKISYFFNGLKLPNNQNSIRDLGIIVSDDLSWDAHVNKISKNALSRLFILLKAFKSNSPKLLVQMYHTYVRPLLEFATPVFNPTKKLLIDKIEKVQRVALRLIFLRCKELKPHFNAPYEQKLEMLGLESLETRRNKYDLTFLNDYLCGNVKLKLNIAKRKSKTRGAKKKLTIPRSKKAIRQNFFTVRVSSKYTKLPREIHNKKQEIFINGLQALKI